jgi:hypothetical protein
MQSLTLALGNRPSHAPLDPATAESIATILDTVTQAVEAR